ncbi:MAG: DUF3794 domain-containing protein [Clostridia bacterium]|nr:DUF3794 domain-containing protein [Clostridia bacterium]
MNSSQNELGYFPQMPVCDKHLSSELNSDFTLPDYKCEIRRLLSVVACVIPPAEYVSNASAQLDGDICYKILYLGADGELYSLNLNDKYAFKLPLDFGFYAVNPDDLTFVNDIRTENVSARVLGPRKLNVKSKLSIHALGLSPELHSPNLVGSHNSSNIENLVCKTQCASIRVGTSEQENVSDFIPLDTSSENVRVIDCYSTVTINECIPQTSQINVRGEVLLKVLYCNDSQNVLPQTAIRKIPFSKSIECAGVNSSYECSCFGIAKDEQIEVQENGISLEASVTLYARAQKNDEVSYIADAYSTEKETELAYSEIKIPRAFKCSNGNLTQNEVMSLEEVGISRDSKIVDVCATAHPEEYSLDNGRLSIKGRCNYQLIHHLDGEYACKNLSAPFKYELDCKFSDNNSLKKYLTYIHVTSSKARCDAERLFLDCELGFDVFALDEGDATLLSEMIFTQSRNKQKSELLLCYPDRDATLWSVAKQYGEPMQAIRKRNSIPENENIPKRRYLVI